MFGENNITATGTISLDSKGRITIPSITGIEAKEKISIIYNLKRDRLILLKDTDYEILNHNFITKLNELYEKELLLAKNKDERVEAYRRYTWRKRVFYGVLSFMPEEADEQHRIKLPSEAIVKLNFGHKIQYIGVEKRLHLLKI